MGKVSMRVFLRLIYTGHVDAADWQHTGAGQSFATQMRVLQQANVNSILQPETSSLLQLTSQAPGWTSSVLLDSGHGGLEFCFLGKLGRTGKRDDGHCPQRHWAACPECLQLSWILGVCQ